MEWTLLIPLATAIVSALVYWFKFRSSSGDKRSGELEAEKRGRETIDDIERRLRESDADRLPKPPD